MPLDIQSGVYVPIRSYITQKGSNRRQSAYPEYVVCCIATDGEFAIRFHRVRAIRLAHGVMGYEYASVNFCFSGFDFNGT
mgnify:CR=1 FL=1